MANGDQSSIHLISEILDKLIDTQSASAEATARMRESVNQVNHTVETLNNHFKNGFRSEIKTHVTSEIKNQKIEIDKVATDISHRVSAVEETAKQCQKTADEALSVLKDLSESLKRPWFWIKVVAGILGSIAIIVAGIIRLLTM